jgi:hypothetical protein
MNDFVYRRDGSEWVVYEIIRDNDRTVLDRELARDRSIVYAERSARDRLREEAEAEERERIAREFEEALFGLTIEERRHRRMLEQLDDIARSMRPWRRPIFLPAFDLPMVVTAGGTVSWRDWAAAE